MIKKIIIAVSVVIQFTVPAAYSEEKVEKRFYDICQKNVEKVDVISRDNKFYVRVRLTEKAGKSFADITGENVNKLLWISAGQYLFARGIIQGRVESAVIQSLPMTEQGALNVQQLILSDKNLRCGLVEVALQENIWKPHLKKYLQDKYPRVDEVIAQDIVRTKNGTKGHILINGEIQPTKQPRETTKEDGVVEVVKDLIMQEKELFGFRSEEEIHVDKVGLLSFPRGVEYYVNVSRYIQDVNVTSHFLSAHVSEDYKITYLTSTMDIVLPEVYDLVSKPMINKETAETTMIADCQKTKQDSKIKSVRYLGKMALHEDPFIVWHGECDGYGYQIDAFTGRILTKSPPRVIVD